MRKIAFALSILFSVHSFAGEAHCKDKALRLAHSLAENSLSNKQSEKDKLLGDMVIERRVISIDQLASNPGHESYVLDIKGDAQEASFYVEYEVRSCGIKSLMDVGTKNYMDDMPNNDI